MRKLPPGSYSFKHPKAGFTLVEMLVATALVVLMMLLFAQVFQTSSGLVSRQKGLAKNDQSSRTLTILLRGDIRQRTFVDVVPFVAGQNTALQGIPPFDEDLEKGYDAELRQGFFSISENDPNDPTDDVLHLTVRTNSPLAKSLRVPYSGRSRLLGTPGAMQTNDQYLQANPDQPEFDDGYLTVNNTGSSPYAEVCWFLRQGKLYRRIFLIRSPYYRGNPPNTGGPEEPRAFDNSELITSFYDYNYDGTPDYFWRDFDYSAYWEPGTPGELKFHTTLESLKNASDSVANANLANLPPSLGIPFLRFGSSTNRVKGSIIYPPREYITDGTNTRFIGRFTAQETADPDFKYPGGFNTVATPNDYTQNDPYNFSVSMPAAANDKYSNPPGRTFTINAANGLVDPYHDDTARRGEDVVMSDVHEFDIQVWDESLQKFVNLGNTETVQVPNPTGPPTSVPSWFHQSRKINPDFGNSFDTWHPHASMPQYPPYAPFGSNPRIPPPTATDEQTARTASTNMGLGQPEEIWLKAIRIKVRFYDIGSEQMRDLTFTFRLDRETVQKD